METGLKSILGIKVLRLPHTNWLEAEKQLQSAFRKSITDQAATEMNYKAANLV